MDKTILASRTATVAQYAVVFVLLLEGFSSAYLAILEIHSHVPDHMSVVFSNAKVTSRDASS